jgi:hypothetical protein
LVSQLLERPLIGLPLISAQLRQDPAGFQRRVSRPDSDLRVETNCVQQVAGVVE